MSSEKIIHVNDKMQQAYEYKCVAQLGCDFGPGFQPFYSPAEMLEMGVFEGKYLNDCKGEFPIEWYLKAKLCDVPDESVNYFGIKSRQSLSIWKDRGWLIDPDPRGWFQWYCRYWMGRRLPEIDDRQIKRWRNFSRHIGQIRKHCMPGDVSCRPRQRQALLQWSYDPFV